MAHMHQEEAVDGQEAELASETKRSRIFVVVTWTELLLLEILIAALKS
jgi:hypothetical protein